MKILFVLEHFYPYLGGVEFLFMQLGKSLVKQGYRVEVITTKFDDKLKSVEELEGIIINRVNCKNRFLFTFKSLPKILSLSKGADIIHTTTYNAALPAFIIGTLKKKKTIVTFHEYWGTLWEKLPYLTFIERKLFRFFEYTISRLRFDRIVAVSDFTRDSLIESGVSERRVLRIYNGLDYEAIDNMKKKILENPIEKGEFKEFIFIGRLGVSKGIDLIIPAVQKVLEENRKAIFKMVIPKVPAKIYRIILGELEKIKCKDRVKIFHNLSKDRLYQEILSSEFIIIPSYSEGFCFMAAEAQALGVPIVSSNLGALREVVSGTHIHLDELSVEGIHRAINLALESRWSIKDSCKFTLEKSVNDYVNLYQELINAE